MIYWCALALVMAVLLVASTAGAMGRRAAAPTGRETEEAPKSRSFAPPVSTNRLTRAELEQRLAKLAKTPRPKMERICAMCYVVAPDPVRVEYVCPTCGEKTLYVSAERLKDSQAKRPAGAHEVDDAAFARITHEGVQNCRRLVKELRGLQVELREKSFCAHCSPGVKNPQLGLVIRYPDGREHGVWGIMSADLYLIQQFLDGKVLSGDLDDSPLQDSLPRLRELLGVSGQRKG